MQLKNGQYGCFRLVADIAAKLAFCDQ